MNKSVALLGMTIIIISVVAMFYTDPSFNHPKGVKTIAVITEEPFVAARVKYSFISGVTVSYEVDGTAYERGLVEGLPFNTDKGREIEIYYNPNSPEEIWGASNFLNSAAKVLLIAGVIILVAGIGFGLIKRRT
ncbi:MAG: hypothetical protein FWG14_02305 [Peptococcaceae bacterium]|nr:hypothetical protein [Peptococcaceae bacterium]